MYSSFSLFKKNIGDAKSLSTLYGYLSTSISLFPFDDLLRSQIVYSVSAFDKLLHDLIRVGIVQIYSGSRMPTSKYLMESISMELYTKLNSTTFPPKEYIFDKIIFDKLKIVSYQDPQKISDGLSYIWTESQKWQKISKNMSMVDDDIKKKLKLIAGRRNAIVHEADIDPSTNTKFAISQVDCDDITNFLYCCGSEIYNLVK